MTDNLLPPDCFGHDDAKRLTQMFVGTGQQRRIRRGQQPAERAVFRKLHGVAHGRLVVLDSAPADLRVGIFTAGELAAWVRFSSDAAPTDADLGTTLGIGIKLFGVPGPKALGEDSQTADLVMQNHPVFFVDDAKAMVEFTYAGVVRNDYDSYLATHPVTDRILKDMARPESSVLSAAYWAILPFRLGQEVVKYRLEPAVAAPGIPDDDPDYLATDLANRLRRADQRFTLSVQRRSDPSSMPLDRATVEWPEEISPFEPVAVLELPRQDISARGQSSYGQNLSYNIWRVPQANAPVEESSIAVVRRAVYAAGANLRHTANGEPLGEPSEPRSSSAEHPTESTDLCIVKAVIFPSIGVARVGNSPSEYLIGPEVPDPPALPAGSYRDDSGRIKRQAARFRIYGVNVLGEIVRELTGVDPDVDIRWSVELANTKSAWYTFQLALDVPEAVAAPPTTLRNPAVEDRTQLAITPGSREVAGANSGPEVFDTGRFMGRPVYLGEIFTDERQRLVVLGGRGASASHDGSRALTFANNEGWYDDISDGPVTAEVTVNGVTLDVVPAWVIVAPPNYAPQRKSVRTMWDLMRDLAVSEGMLPAPTRPSFTFDILPIFQRLAGLQWVNAGFAAGFGWGGAFDLTSTGAMARLSSTEPAHRETRRVIANSFRSFAIDANSPKPWPWLYGDAMNIPPVASPRQNAALTDTQLTLLAQWAEGDFVADYDPQQLHPTCIEAVAPAQQGDVLTRAALEFCLADAFHPGCEMTWPVRAASMYSGPFRFLHAPPGWVVPTLGTVLTSDAVTIPGGPLYGQQAGDLTRWMAVPWQTDTASCRSGYSREYDPYVPSFWPARVPNQILTVENYRLTMDPTLSAEQRLSAFANRAAWIEPLGSVSYTQQINNMIEHFDHLGIVEERPGPTDDAGIPDRLEVEDQHLPITIDEGIQQSRLGGTGPAGRGTSGGGATARVPARSAADVDVSGIEKVRRFPGGLPR